MARTVVAPVRAYSAMRSTAAGFFRARHVDVHLGDAGHQILAAAVHSRRPGRHAHRRRGPDRGDPASLHHDVLGLEHPLPVHRNDGNVGEDDGAGIGGRLRDETAADAAAAAVARTDSIGFPGERVSP